MEKLQQTVHPSPMPFFSLTDPSFTEPTKIPKRATHFDLSHLHPERFHGPGALFVDGEAVREVDHVVLGAVDHQDGGRNLCMKKEQGVNSIDINLGPKMGPRCKIENTVLKLARKQTQKRARDFLCQLN